ncbi:MAG: 50S ribosomal protein L23 [Thermodesulfobacteriota bacterium]|nr:50S ribosomal protein L23 [Thermodesulfobacteriota bacterium]
MKNFTRIIEAPLITEKGTAMRQEDNKAVFKVDRDANKIEIKKAVEGLFNVHVEDVRTLRVKGKKKRWGRHEYKRPTWKKAIVKIRRGESIEVYEGV